MYFALDACTQSEMRIDDPYALVSEYSRKMKGFLAFQPNPKQILIIGLGGGILRMLVAVRAMAPVGERGEESAAERPMAGSVF
jgi:spermidine synthase